jgi:4-amino-4-deoxy-L-arabinose transferase-like glycosyltransferase
MRGGTKASLLAAFTGFAVLGAAWAADDYLSHGWSAEWRLEHRGTAEVVARTTEHRLHFPNEHRALSRYIQHWDFKRKGVPRTLPRLDAKLSGVLRVPEGGPRTLRAASPEAVRLELNGRELPEGETVPPGEHALDVHWSGAFGKKTSLAILWATGGGAYEPVPAAAIAPTAGRWTTGRRWLWGLAPLLALLLAGLVWRAAAAPTPVAGRRRWGALAVVVVALLSLGYRAYDYSVMPEFRENYDELFATWNGWSLLNAGETRGWSLWPGHYQGRVHIEPFHYFSPKPFSVIQPYFEHPPLLHLLVGAAATLGGAEHWAHARLAHTRLVPIALGVLTALLLMAVGRRLDPRGPGPYLGGLLYAVLPIVALQGRVVKEEALVAPLALGSLLFFLRWRDQGERRADLVGAGLLAGLATLAKVPGLVFVVALVMLVLQRGRVREAVWAGAAGLLAAAPLLAYAAAIDWDVFWYTTLHQASGRPSHWNLFPRFFDDPLINHNLVGRPWLLFLWLAFALALRSLPRANRSLLVVPPLLYLLGIGVSSGNWTFGWYLMPVYPFLCIGAGRFLADLWERPDLLHGVLFITLAVMYGMSFTMAPEEWIHPSAWPETRRTVALFLGATLLPYALVTVWRIRALRVWAQATTVAGLALLVGLSGYFVVHYDQIYDTHHKFDRVEFFDR